MPLGLMIANIECRNKRIQGLSVGDREVVEKLSVLQCHCSLVGECSEQRPILFVEDPLTRLVVSIDDTDQIFLHL